MAQVNHPSRLSQEPIERLNFEDFRRIKCEGRTRLVTSLERFGIYGSVGEGMSARTPCESAHLSTSTAGDTLRRLASFWMMG
eukprot:scaffold8_cov249-Pinguiococcus_pyrenoidosus.AAC.25